MKNTHLVLFLCLLSISVTTRIAGERQNTRTRRTENAVGCAPPMTNAEIRADTNGRFAPVFPGWGHYGYKITATGDSTQFFFNQGLNLYYSYHMLESLASFKEAARRDPKCLMAWWGQALAMGPYYNGYGYKMPSAVLPVLAFMNKLAATGKGREKELAILMNKRYSADSSDARRNELNRAYSVGWLTLIKKYPRDPDMKALYVDAVMLEHSWDFWDQRGIARPWTVELVNLCDTILKTYPHHPGALHYQIHLVEASMNPEKALPNADLLVKDLPGVPHMVHMSSHMYQRNGLYGKGVEVNLEAAGLQIHYDSMAKNLGIGTMALTHFAGVGAYCAMNANLYAKGTQQAMAERELLSGTFKTRLSNTFFQYLYMLPAFVDVRSGKWKKILETPAPDSNMHYAALLDHFAKGIACVRLRDVPNAQAHLDKLIELKSYPELQTRNMPFNAAIDPATIAEEILWGELLLAVGRSEEGIKALGHAMVVEDGMIYREPKDWPIPARQFLGAALMRLGQYETATRIYRQDLAENQGNGWSLLGLYQCLVRGPKEGWAEAARCKEEYLRAFGKSEEIPKASVY